MQEEIPVSDFNTCSFCHLCKEKMIKQCDHTPYTKNCNNRSKSYTDKMSCEDQSHRDGNADVKKIKAVFGKSHRSVDTVGDSLYDSVSGVGDDAHIQ